MLKSFNLWREIYVARWLLKTIHLPFIRCIGMLISDPTLSNFYGVHGIYPSALSLHILCTNVNNRDLSTVESFLSDNGRQVFFNFHRYGYNYIPMFRVFTGGGFNTLPPQPPLFRWVLYWLLGGLGWGAATFTTNQTDILTAFADSNSGPDPIIATVCTNLINPVQCWVWVFLWDDQTP